MIPHTKAFKRLKDEVQLTFDYAIVVCYAVPSLKATLRQIAPGESLSFAPDHFDARPIPTEKVRHHLAHYKEALSRHIFLSSFAYFEAYFVDLLREIVAFHGKDRLLQKHDLKRNTLLSAPELSKAMKKLREPRTNKNLDAYRSYGKRLSDSGFVFPSSVLAQHGLRNLLRLIASDDIKSVQIPDLIESVLQLQLDKDVEVAAFNEYRKIRNKIAHGRAGKASLHLAKAIEANNFLRNLALKVDAHVTTNLLLVEL